MLYLPRQMWTMNETLIFFKIRRVLKNIDNEAVFTKTDGNNKWNVNFLQNTTCVKNIDNEAVFTKTEMKDEWNVYFLQNTKCVLKSIETEIIFTKTGRNNKWNVNFLKGSPLGIQHTYSIK